MIAQYPEEFTEKEQQQFSLFLGAVLFMTEWHSGQKQTAKVIIICGHAPSHAHLTDGDNLSQHFSIKKENRNKQKARENTYSRARANKDAHTS